MAIHPLECLSGHSQKASRLPNRNAGLGEPSCSSVPQGMRHYIRPQPRCFPYGPESLIDLFDRFPVPLDNGPVRQPQIRPAAKMGEEARGQPYRRLTLLRLSHARCSPIKHATVEVYPTFSHRRLEGRRADGPGTGASIEGDQNEASNMLSCGPRSNFTILTLSKTPCCPKEASGFRPRQPTDSCRGSGGSATGICPVQYPFSQ
jgi:hypothetical protein